VKLACVVQRYGAGIAGGSEAHCREVAERLAISHDVTVLTTCATDYVTWANRSPAGDSRENGVLVKRFEVARERRLKRFADVSDRVFDGPSSEGEQREWFEENGPDAPGLLEHLRQHGRDYDLVLFWTFRYAPSFFGLPLVADRAVLVPTAEEDAALDLDLVGEFFRQPAGYLFLTPEERDFVSARAERPLEPCAVIGIGLEPASPSDSAVLASLALPPRFLLYLGRIDRNKGCHTLFEYFQDYATDRPDAALVLAGPSTLPIPDHPRIRALGFVSDAVRHALLAKAEALVVPSPYESLSIVLLEAWNRGVPSLVNAHCSVLQGQVRRAQGGLYYRTSREFAEAADALFADASLRSTLGRRGLAYVDREYRWPTVLRRIDDLLAAAVSRRDSRQQ
jgi:glycosyltransferase involved in cell wall biosynthesis